MSKMAARLRDRFYANDAHPYRVFEREVDAAITPTTAVLLDAGCGRSAPVLRRFLGRIDRLIGVEMVEFTGVPDAIETYVADLAHMPLADNCVDLIISRSVFEHLTDPKSVYLEMARVLRPGGRIIFLTANWWDYGTQIARLVPNRLHGRVVRMVEGRKEEDTFPTAYKTNTPRDVHRLAMSAGLRVQSFRYLSQYPNYLMFNGLVFLLGMAYEKLISRFEALRSLRGWILVSLVKPGASAP